MRTARAALRVAIPAAVVACADTPLAPTTGSVVLSLAPAGGVTLVMDSARITVSGPVDRTLVSTGSTTSAHELDALPPGEYSATVEGFQDNAVAFFGSRGDITVVAGAATQRQVSVGSFVPQPMAPGSVAVLRFTVSYSPVAQATGYIIAWGPMPRTAVSVLRFVEGTTDEIQVGAAGVYWVAVRARNAIVGTNGKESAPVIVQASQGVATIAVTPASPSIAHESTQQFAAEARDADNVVIPNTAFTWASLNSAVATVNATGLATGVGGGTATITAAADGTTGSATLTVGAPVVVTVQVAPTTHLNFVAATRQLTATARSAGGQVIAGTAFTWSSTQPGVATVDPSTGLVTAVSNGSTTINAVAGGISGSTTITVLQVPASVTGSVAVDTILAAGQAKTFTAQVRDSGNAVIANASVRWSSAHATVASIDSVTGVATANAAGTATLTARSGTATGNVSLVVRNGTLVNGRVLLTDYGNITDNAYVVDDYFVVWWHKSGNYAVEAQQILAWLKGIRTEALQLGLHHPPNEARGTYLNVYLHEPGPGNDNYPGDWGAGVGTDGNALPFLAVGTAQRNDQQLFRHEGFHLFQYTGVRASPGFEYAGDGSWYSEASATWFSLLGFRTDDNAHRGAATVPANPQLALWHGWTNNPPGDPANWNRTTRQYALATWLDYLNTTGGVPASVLVEGFVTPTTVLPQELLNARVAGLGATFADYAAASTPDMPYLTRPQWTLALQDLATYGDAADRHEYVLDLTDAGTGGAFVAPAAALLPRGWGWNVIRVHSTQAATWRFEVDGVPTGSAGAAAVFQARVLLQTSGGRVVHTVPLPNALDGFVSVSTTATPTTMYLIVAAVPLNFRGHQTYAYAVKIDRTP